MEITVDGVTLKPGDRLEPSDTLRDTHALEKATLPLLVTFWRPQLGDGGKVIDSVMHRCPLYSEALHASPNRTLAVDSLHTLFLGPVLRFVSAALWR
eukprot:6103597-Pyramimonas_sp.AAC.1